MSNTIGVNKYCKIVKKTITVIIFYGTLIHSSQIINVYRLENARLVYIQNSQQHE